MTHATMVLPQLDGSGAHREVEPEVTPAAEEAMNRNYLVSIGNSSPTGARDRLSQAEWAQFIQHTIGLLESYGAIWHGKWYSSPTDPWQNANFCFELPPRSTLAAFMAHEADLIGQLAVQAALYRQESIALTYGPVRFIRAAPGIAPSRSLIAP
jgi:hypothetical protein